MDDSLKLALLQGVIYIFSTRKTSDHIMQVYPGLQTVGNRRGLGPIPEASIYSEACMEEMAEVPS